MEEQNSPVIFSDWIKHRRKALDLTQDELAKRAGCSVSALRKIESGERRPSKQLAGLLAQALEIPNEDQQTFIRVARGELNIERLRQPDAESDVPASDLWEFIENHQSRVDEGQSLVYRIPSPSTPLIGRDNELKAVIRLFNDPHCRLITLTGTGGVGKTRLAIEFGWRSFSEFPGGVFYIPLTPVKSPKEIVSAIADVLEFRFSGPSDPKEQLFNYIASDIKQEALFILDNLEHLLFGDSTNDQISSVAELISAMMEFLPNVKILGTSRERLN
ncbi:MAG: ATP-binding protein, partial [Anaerolineales bacterium]